MITHILYLWLGLLVQIGIHGEYRVEKTVDGSGGPLRHTSVLRLDAAGVYKYTDVAVDKSGQTISSDTIRGEWYLKEDTLITRNYEMKWLVRKRSLVKLSSVRLVYRKQ